MAASEPREALASRVVVRGDELTGQEAPHVLGEASRIGVAIRRLERERLVDDRDELRRSTRRGDHDGHDLVT